MRRLVATLILSLALVGCQPGPTGNPYPTAGGKVFSAPTAGGKVFHGGKVF